MPERRLHYASNTLPGPSESEGSRQFPSGPDDDGLTDWAETFLWGTDPNLADTDGDGKDDGTEIA